jgi:hypothetical protein
VEIDDLDTTTNEIQHNQSEERIIQYGVPWESILGPLLFQIHINDADSNIRHKTSVKLTFLADDNSTLINGKNINELPSNLDTINSIISCFDKKTDY